VGHTLTPNWVDDASQLAPLLEQTPSAISTVSADGAYDKRKVFSYLEKTPTEYAPTRNAAVGSGD
jgi:hypothetical protein